MVKIYEHILWGSSSPAVLPFTGPQILVPWWEQTKETCHYVSIRVIPRIRNANFESFLDVFERQRLSTAWPNTQLKIQDQKLAADLR